MKKIDIEEAEKIGLCWKVLGNELATLVCNTCRTLPELIRCANCKHCGLARYNDGAEHRPYLYTYVCHRFEELFEGQRFEVDFDDYCRWAERETL